MTDAERQDDADREDLGEADLGDAQAEDAPTDPAILVDAEASDGPDDAELTDVPALEPEPGEAEAIEQTERAASEAGSVGGATPEQRLDPAEHPVAEAGGGESEGFELAEQDLVESASHGDRSGDPLRDRFTPEDVESEGVTIHGEADDAVATEDSEDDG